MERSTLRLATVVLAAGAGTRFGPHLGAKLLAELRGKPLLVHVLEAVRAASEPAAASAATTTTVVVLGHGADAVEQAIGWREEIRIRNHDPERGLASSLQLGIDTLRTLPEPFDGAFIVLGDQPLLRPGTLTTLAAAAGRARPADRPAVVPHYETSGARNPVLLLRPAWSWVDELSGDHGLGVLLDDRPDQVLQVLIKGDMPDVDVPEDLDRIAAAGKTPEDLEPRSAPAEDLEGLPPPRAPAETPEDLEPPPAPAETQEDLEPPPARAQATEDLPQSGR